MIRVRFSDFLREIPARPSWSVNILEGAKTRPKSNLKVMKEAPASPRKNIDILKGPPARLTSSVAVLKEIPVRPNSNIALQRKVSSRLCNPEAPRIVPVMPVSNGAVLKQVPDSTIDVSKGISNIGQK